MEPSMKNELNDRRFTATASKTQIEQMQILADELRWSRSEIIRKAIDLLFNTHQNNPQQYGV